MSIKFETRFFSLLKIPRPTFVTAEFSYNYFVPDESTNSTGISKYDAGQFKSTSYKTDEGGSYKTDDQGNKLIVDNFGNLVSESTLSTRSPRHVTIQWSPPTQTTTIPNPPAPGLQSLEAQGLIMRQEEIASIYDVDVKFFDPKVRKRLDEKIRLLAALCGYDPYTDEGLVAVQDELRKLVSNETMFTDSMGYYPNSEHAGQLSLDSGLIDSAVPRIVDMNMSAGMKRVNDLGNDVESTQFENAANYIVDAKVDRRVLYAITHNDLDRNYFSKRQLIRFLKGDSADRNNLPKEPNRIVGQQALPAATRESGLSLSSPILVAQSVGRPTVSSDSETPTTPYAQTDLIGYIVERYRVTDDFSLDTPEKIIYINSPNVCNAIDTEILYGQRYYYTVRSVYMRESELFDHSISEFNRVRSYFACTATDPVYIEAKESTPPAEPDGVFYKFNHNAGKGLIITWQYPVGKQRDTKYFQIFRRSSINEPFTCIAEIDFNDATIRAARQERVNSENVIKFSGTTTYYEDVEFTRNSQFIYAVAAVDAHGLSSGYSAQTHVSFKKERNVILLKAISQSGAPKQYPNFFVDPDLDDSTFVRTLTQDVMKSSGKQTVRIYFDADCEKIIFPDSTIEKHVGFGTENHTYKMHFINLDRHKDDSVEIRLTDFRNEEV